MKHTGPQRELCLFVCGITLIALYISLKPAPAGFWLLDLFTAIAAAGAGLAVCVRLAFAMPARVARLSWLVALSLFAALCVGQLAAMFLGGGATGGLGGVPGARYALLAAALVLLGLTTRFESAPMGVWTALWTAFAAQATGAATAGSAAVPDLLDLVSVQLYLLGVAWLVAHLRRRAMVVERRPTDVGDLARYLFATSRLFKKVRHPRIANYTVPGHKLVFIIGRFLSWYPLIGPRVRQRFGVGLWRQFRDLWAAALRHGLDAQVYYMFELYRPDRRARTSGYLTRYELKNGLYKVLTWQVSKKRKRIMLGDKLGMFRICEANGIPTVPILAIADGGRLDYRCDPRAGLARDLFLKPRQAKGSRGAELIRYADGTYTREDGTTLDHDGLVALIAQRSLEMAMLVQPRIGNHPGLADLADMALMRIRVITCLDRGGQPVITHAVLSNLCKLELNWPTDIEIGAAVNLETGALGLATGDKAAMWLDWSEVHPITRARVLGRIVPCWSEVRSTVLAAHAACSDRLLIGWDVAVGPEGALLLEGNSYPDVDFLQRAHQCAIGDSALGPLLYDRLVEIEQRAANGTLRGPMDFD